MAKNQKQPKEGIVEQMRKTETPMARAALLKKAQSYKHISPKTLRKLEKLAK
tara:strand:+ start:888 stop:1043 length:156 start_codon:yes stop_codon:yes gene_type:complete